MRRQPQKPESARRIVVLGGGSAGCLTALALRKHLPDHQVTMVRSTRMGVIGVGEGTIWSVVQFLHRFLGIDVQRFHREVGPTIKLGIRYHWGPRPFFHYTFTPQFSQTVPNTQCPRGFLCLDEYDYADEASALMFANKACFLSPQGQPQMVSGYAYHLENRRFVGFLESLCGEWGVEILDAVVTSVEREGGWVRSLGLDSGEAIPGDWFVDGSGFRRTLIGESPGGEFVDFRSVLPCNAAIFGGWDRSPGETVRPYTTVDTLTSGWAWQIEHERVVNRGYVYSDRFSSADEAEAEFRRLNPRIQKTSRIGFQAGAWRQSWIGNVIAVGNAAGFVEPLEATAIGVICDSAIQLIRGLQACEGAPSEAVASAYSRIQFENWEIIRDFLALHYRFNQRLDTPFWRSCSRDVPLGRTQAWVDYYRQVGPDFGLLGPEFRRDFFDREGYLAMLLGQQLPTTGGRDIALPTRHHWQTMKNRLGDRLVAAMDVSEFLDHMRDGPPLAPSPALADLQQSSIGELRWH